MIIPDVRSVADFVAREETQEENCEFADGVASLFQGGTMRHEILVATLIHLLHPIVGAGHVRSSGLKQLTATSSRYPDISAASTRATRRTNASHTTRNS